MSGGATVVTLERVDGAEWDSILLPDRLAQTYRFHRALAGSRINDCDYRYFRYRDARGRLVAHCSFYSISTPLDLFLPRSHPATRALAGVRLLYPRFFDFLAVECGSPTTLGYPVAFRAGVPAEQQREVWNALVPNLENTVLRMRWATFEEYLGSLRARCRRQVRLNLARGQRAGLRIEPRCPPGRSDVRDVSPARAPAGGVHPPSSCRATSASITRTTTRPRSSSMPTMIGCEPASISECR